MIKGILVVWHHQNRLDIPLAMHSIQKFPGGNGGFTPNILETNWNPQQNLPNP
jgi:hypothetical protein